MAVQAEFYPENVGFQDYWVGNPVDFGFSSLDQPQQTLLSHDNADIQQFGIPISSSLSSSSTCDSFFPMKISQSLDLQLQIQRQELDYILQIRNERLRLALQCQRKQHLANLLKNMESRAFYLINQKEEDLARATSKTIELEACLKKTEMETESWKKLAAANEEIAMDLTKSLEQVKERFALVNSTIEDAESCFSCHNEQEITKLVCKNCNSGKSCVLFLPCRHLCSCKNCESLLGSCPVCKSVKEASMEVFWG